MALFRVTLDGNLLSDEPEGLMDFVSELRRDKKIGGQVLLVDLILKFKGGTDGYNILKPLIDCQGFCSFSEIQIDESCNNDDTWVEIFDGLIFYTNIKEHLFPCILETTLTDNSFFAKIDNNKNIEAFVNVGRSKNDETISPAQQYQAFFFDVNSGANIQAVDLFPVWTCFEFIIDYMTDGEMGFVSDYFGLTSTTDGKYMTITTGNQIRLGLTNGTIFPFISFQKLFDEVNKKVPIAFSIETIAGVKTMRIEPRSYFFETGISTTLNNVKGIVKSVNTSELYSRVKLGSTETIEYVTGATDFPTNIRFAGFKEESYTTTGKCNLDNTLDLVSDWIIDSNVIQDVLGGNTGYEENIFIVMVDYISASPVAIATDVFGTGLFFYNDFLRNQNVALRWLGAIPNSIALYLGDGNDEFRASVTTQVTNTLTTTAPTAVYSQIAFQDDFTTPNFDVNGNYSTITNQFTVPSSGLYSFYSDVTWIEGIGGDEAYIDALGIRLVLRITGSNSEDIEASFSPTATSCQGIVSATRYLIAGDTVETMFKLNPSSLIIGPVSIPFTAQTGSSFACINAQNGGGVFQTYNPEDFKAYQYEIKDYPLTFAQYQAIIASPLKLVAFNGNVNGVEVSGDGWIENKKYHHTKGTADFLLSKQLPKTTCE